MKKITIELADAEFAALEAVAGAERCDSVESMACQLLYRQLSREAHEIATAVSLAATDGFIPRRRGQLVDTPETAALAALREAGFGR